MSTKNCLSLTIFPIKKINCLSQGVIKSSQWIYTGIPKSTAHLHTLIVSTAHTAPSSFNLQVFDGPAPAPASFNLQALKHELQKPTPTERETMWELLSATKRMSLRIKGEKVREHQILAPRFCPEHRLGRNWGRYKIWVHLHRSSCQNEKFRPFRPE